MPKYAEIIYETGEHSIASFDSKEDLLRGVKEHHRRAVNGESFQVNRDNAGPATRVKRVLLYNDHPSNYNVANTIPTGKVNELAQKVALGDEVSVGELTTAMRDEVDPMVNSGPHESNYKMQEAEEVPSSEWETE